jgi:hypothetical protein
MRSSAALAKDVRASMMRAQVVADKMPSRSSASSSSI